MLAKSSLLVVEGPTAGVRNWLAPWSPSHLRPNCNVEFTQNPICVSGWDVSIIVKVFLRSYISLKSATKVSRWCLPYCLLFSTDNIPRKAIEDKHWKWHMQSVKQDLCCYWAPQIATSSSTTVRTRAKKGSWQVGKAFGKAVGKTVWGGAEKDCKVVESTMAVGNGFLQVYPCLRSFRPWKGTDFDASRKCLHTGQSKRHFQKSCK